MNKKSWLVIFIVLIPLVIHAQFQNLFDFGSGADGKNPQSNQVLIDGSVLYVITQNGGGFDYGTIFKSNLDGSEYTILNEFMCTPGDGKYPMGSLILSGTTLYGMTSSGGGYSWGTIFKIEIDGSGPWGSLILDGTSLYGMTQSGGMNDRGAIFKIEIDGSGFTLLHSFSSGAEIGTQFSKTFVGYDFQAFSPFSEAGKAYPANSYDNVILRVRPTSGAGQLVCFGASANNTSNDPASHLAVQGQ